MCLSSGYSPQAAAHSSQHAAQHFSMWGTRGLCRAHRVEQVLQHSLQPKQSSAVLAWSFLPSASSLRQWAKQESHSIWQAAQALAQFKYGSACSCWAEADGPIRAKTATVSAPAIMDTLRTIVILNGAKASGPDHSIRRLALEYVGSELDSREEVEVTGNAVFFAHRECCVWPPPAWRLRVDEVSMPSPSLEVPQLRSAKQARNSR